MHFAHSSYAPDAWLVGTILACEQNGNTLGKAILAYRVANVGTYRLRRNSGATIHRHMGRNPLGVVTGASADLRRYRPSGTIGKRNGRAA